MSVFGMIGDVIGQLHDMKQLAKIQDDLGDAIEKLESSGTCPADLKSAYEAIKNADKDAKLDETLGNLKRFADTLAAHEDVLPADLKGAVEKYAKVASDLEEKTKDFEKLTGTNK